MRTFTGSIFLSLLLLFFTNVSFGQLKNFGIKGGLNLSNAELDYWSSNYQFENKTGLNVYLLYDFLNFRNIIISGEAGYSQKGFDDKFIYTNEFGYELGRYTIYNRLNYIDINAVAEFILRNKSVSPYFSLGPVLSIYTGYNTSTSGSPHDDSLFIAFEDPILGNLKSPVLGFIVGAGIEFSKIIPQTIITEVRYNFDLTNSFNTEYANFKRNYLWQFNLGVKF